MITYTEFVETYLQTPLFSVKQSQDLPVYYREFVRLHDKPNLTVLEFGVAGGGSLQFYRSILGKDTRIIGVDLNPKCLEMLKHGFEIFIGDQSDPKFLKYLFQTIGNVDIIIEDGGHTNFQQISTIVNGIPYLNDGGVILIDDLQCSYHPRWGNPSKWSTVNYLKKQITEINYRSINLSDRQNPGLFSTTVESITFYESLVAIRVDRELARPGFFITTSGNAEDYSEDFRFLGNLELERLYRVSKIFENRTVWIGKLGFIMNIGIKSRLFCRFALIFIRWTIAAFEIKNGRGTKKFFT